MAVSLAPPPREPLSTSGSPQSCCFLKMVCVAGAELLVPLPRDSPLPCSYPQLGQPWPRALWSTRLSSLPAPP